jgi:putative transport protein
MIMEALLKFLQENPSLLIFAALAGGYALGKVKFGTFSLGSTTSILLVSIVLGSTVLQGTEYDLGLIKNIAFGFFIFTIGYKVGPDFVGGLKRGGAKYVAIAVFFSVTALLTAIVLAKVFSLNQGYSGGLIGGALTQSSVIGTADAAIQQMTTGQVTSALNLKSDVAVAYAVTYVFGTAGLIIFLKLICRLWRVNLPEAARKAEEEMGAVDSGDTIEAFHWSNLVMPRAFRVEKPDVTGMKVCDVEALFPHRVSIERVGRGSTVVDDIAPEFILEKGDIVVLTSYRQRMLGAQEVIGPEVDDHIVTEMIGEILGICLTRKDLDGETIAAVFNRYGHGCYLRSVTRQGHELPHASGLKVRTGDTINVIGSRPDIERLAETIGYPERQTQVTDLVAVGLGLIAGTLIGLLVITIGGIPVTLGVGGGVLVTGIFFGWLRSTRPVWGQIPGPTQWIFIDLGLNLFIACVGISAGPRAIAALKQAGVSILLAGVCLTTVPHLLTWIFGRYLVKLNPALLLGAMTGAGTCTAALNSVKEDAKSVVPVIGYTVPYAIGNVLLTVWGALIVSIIK